MKVREHVHKVSKPRNFAESQKIAGPRGPGVPAFSVQKPKMVNASKVRSPKKTRG